MIFYMEKIMAKLLLDKLKELGITQRYLSKKLAIPEPVVSNLLKHEADFLQIKQYLKGRADG